MIPSTPMRSDRTRHNPLSLLLVATILSPADLRGQAPDPSPEAERAALRVLDGFDVQLFASEEHGVHKPIQIRFGPDGRLWVAGSVVYPQLRPGEKPRDQVVVLEDTDRDGRADRSTVFADDLLMPTGLELGDGGLYVTSGSDLLHLRDTDGDGRADTREVVFRGFGTGDTHQTLNSFTWGPSGELMLSQGLHARSRVETPWGIVELMQAGMWRLWPGERRLEAFWSGAMGAHNPFGTVFDGWGQPFVFAGNGHGIYHLTPGLVATPHFLEQRSLWNQGRKFGGADFVGNSHWPDTHQGEVIAGAYLHNAVDRFRIHDEGGAGYRIERLQPLIESDHVGFRIVDVRFGPDGALYLCDWYNPVIGHYQASFRDPQRDRDRGRIWRVTARGRPAVDWHPLDRLPVAELVATLGSTERWNRQQAARVLTARPADAVADAIRAQARPDTDGRTRFEHLATLATIGRLDPDQLTRAARDPLPEIRAFAARLIGQGAARPLRPLAPDRALVELARLTDDPHPRVRLEAVVACSRVPAATAVEVAARVADHPVEPAIEYAFTQCVHALEPHWRPAAERGGLRFEGQPAREALFSRAAGGDDAARRAAARLRRIGEVALDPDVLSRLAATVAADGGTNELLTLLAPGSFRRGPVQETALQAAALRQAADASLRRHLRLGDAAAAGLDALLANPDPALQAAAARLAGAWNVGSLRPRVESMALEPDLDPDARNDALAGLAGFGDPAARDRLADVATSATQPAVQANALALLVRLDPARAAPLAAGWMRREQAGPEVDRVVTAFLQRPESVATLRDALADRPPARGTARAALELLGSSGRRDPHLAAVLKQAAGVERPRDPVTPDDIPAILAGLPAADPGAGARLFASPNLACTGCHSVDGTPGRVGPDLSSLGTAQNPEFILGAILDPQREVKEGFMAWEVVARDGTTYQGYLQGEDAGAVTLSDHLTGTIVRLPVQDIASRSRLGSLMPAGLLDSLGREEVRDLTAYLSRLGRRDAER